MHNIAKGNWNIAKGKLKQMVGRVTQNNLQLVEGKVDELVGRIQRSAGAGRRQRERAAQLLHEKSYGHR